MRGLWEDLWRGLLLLNVGIQSLLCLARLIQGEIGDAGSAFFIALLAFLVWRAERHGDTCPARWKVW